MYSRILLLLSLIIYSAIAVEIKPIVYKDDNSHLRLAPKLHPKSHIKVFLPSIPYSYIAKNTNAGLIRSSDNDQGWVYDLAKSHERVDEYTYIFEIRKNLKFQDGSDFTIDNVIRNLEYFKQYPFLYTNIDKVDFDIIRVDDYRVKFKLKQKYEMFFLDFARIYFYTDEYLTNYAPKGAQTGTANEVPGPYGMGPYILTDGYAIGEKQTDKLELIANPFYWHEEYPKINHITVYTQLNTTNALNNIVNHEGKLDISPIPFNKKIDVLMSKYSKLIISDSTNHFLIYFNLINGNKKLKNIRVRQALNEALNQENLLNFVYKKEGKYSPFTASINYKIVKRIAQKQNYPIYTLTEHEKHKLLNGLTLNVFTQDRFMFLWKGIEYQLKAYGVTLNFEITTSEKDIYKQLLTTKDSKNSYNWDMLTWGDDDWYYQNPWTLFFIYEKDSPWSTIGEDLTMQSYIEKYFTTNVNSEEYETVVERILCRAKSQAYTLRVPSPNKVIAVNKEVVYKPYKGGIIPLWEIQITKDHWSLRGSTLYPKEFYEPYKPKRDKE